MIVRVSDDLVITPIEILLNSELAKQLQVIREQYELRGEVENVNTITNLISLSREKAVRKQTCIRDFFKN